MTTDSHRFDAAISTERHSSQPGELLAAGFCVTRRPCQSCHTLLSSLVLFVRLTYKDFAVGNGKQENH